MKAFKNRERIPPGHLLGPEARLLMLAAGASDDDATRAILREPINWKDLCILAHHEKASSVLVRQLNRLGVEIGDYQYLELRQLATDSVMQMLQLEQLLNQILDFLASEKIDAVLLKGAGLAYTVYASFPDRPMGDIDVLVRPEHAQRAWSLLQKKGWTPLSTDEQSTRHAGHHHLPPLFHDGATFRLEIHDALLPGEHPFRFSTAEIWRRARQITVNGRTILVPALMHQLWHICVHFAWSHAMQWGSWRAVRDTAAIIRRGEVDWTQFVSFARESRAATCCFWTLRLTRRLTGAAVPDYVLTSLQPPYPDFIIDRLERHFVSSLFPSEDRCPSVLLTRRLWEAGVSPRWSGHGAARPWQVSERWIAASGLPKSKESASRAVTRWVRRMGASVTYLLRLTGFALPITMVTAQTST